jgi:hypothetical protein
MPIRRDAVSNQNMANSAPSQSPEFKGLIRFVIACAGPFAVLDKTASTKSEQVGRATNRLLDRARVKVARIIRSRGQLATVPQPTKMRSTSQ